VGISKEKPIEDDIDGRILFGVESPTVELFDTYWTIERFVVEQSIALVLQHEVSGRELAAALPTCREAVNYALRNVITSRTDKD
jgi:hypothetical protein